MWICPDGIYGTEIASEGLKGRVFEFSLGDLNNDEDLVSQLGLEQASWCTHGPEDLLFGTVVLLR